MPTLTKSRSDRSQTKRRPCATLADGRRSSDRIQAPEMESGRNKAFRRPEVKESCAVPDMCPAWAPKPGSGAILWINYNKINILWKKPANRQIGRASCRARVCQYV